MDRMRIVRYFGVLCCILAVFAVAIMLIGYQPWDVGHTATVVLLVVGTVVCFRVSRTKPSSHNHR